MDPVHDVVDQSNANLTPAPTANSLEERRRRRNAALQAAEGLWKYRVDIPKDGAEYQKQLRDEWL